MVHEYKLVKKYNYHDILEKKQSTARTLLLIAGILRYKAELQYVFYALDLLRKIYRYKKITSNQLAGLERIYIRRDSDMGELTFTEEYIDNICGCTDYAEENRRAFALLIASIPKLLSTLEDKEGPSSVVDEKLMTTSPFELKLNDVLCNNKYTVQQRNTAIKIILDMNVLGRTTKHMNDCLDSMLPNNKSFDQYIPLPKKRSLLDGYLSIWDLE